RTPPPLTRAFPGQKQRKPPGCDRPGSPLSAPQARYASGTGQTGERCLRVRLAKSSPANPVASSAKVPGSGAEVALVSRTERPLASHKARKSGLPGSTQPNEVSVK